MVKSVPTKKQATQRRNILVLLIMSWLSRPPFISLPKRKNPAILLLLPPRAGTVNAATEVLVQIERGKQGERKRERKGGFLLPPRLPSKLLFLPLPGTIIESVRRWWAHSPSLFFQMAGAKSAASSKKRVARSLRLLTTSTVGYNPTFDPDPIRKESHTITVTESDPMSLFSPTQQKSKVPIFVSHSGLRFVPKPD